MGVVDWRDEAACLGLESEVFFPSNGGNTGGPLARARAICAACPVAGDCLAYALQWPAYSLEGIWAGTTQKQRQRLRAAGRPRRAA